MIRSETFPINVVHTIKIRMAWANIEVVADDVDDFQFLVSGDVHDVGDLRIQSEGGVLLCEQPSYGLSIKLTMEHWMQVTLRIPKAWKGAVDAFTTTANLTVRGLCGTDFSVDTVTGNIMVSDMHFITAAYRTVSGKIKAMECAFDEIHLHTITAEAQFAITAPFRLMEGATVSGEIYLSAPIDKADIVYRAVTGRVMTDGVSIVEGAPRIALSSVNGDLHIKAQNHG